MLEMNGSVFDSCIQGQNVMWVYVVWFLLVKREEEFFLQSYNYYVYIVTLKEYADKIGHVFSVWFFVVSCKCQAKTLQFGIYIKRVIALNIFDMS